MRKNQRGFTLVEILIVVCLVGIIASFSVARGARARVRTQNAMAQRHIASYVTTARTAAMQRGAVVTLRINADSVWITADSLGTELPLRPALFLSRYYTVSTSTTVAAVPFSPRGYAPSLPQTGARFVVVPAVSGYAISDTVCVGRTGKVRTRGCA